MKERLETARAEEEAAAAASHAAAEELETLRAEIAEARDHLGEMQADAAAKEAQLEMLKDESAAKTVLENVLQDATGDVRLVAQETGREGAEVKPGDRLVDHLSIAEDEREAADRLLGDVVLVGGEKGVWNPSTAVESSSGRMSPITEAERALADLKSRIEHARETLATGAERTAALAETARAAEVRLTNARRAAAQAEGECGSVARDAASVKERLERVRAELEGVNAANAGDDARRAL